MISVVVPCYNCEKTFARCIESLLLQTQRNFEIVLVDDGSVDNTYSLCEEIARDDARVKVIHQQNKGLMNAWKKGVSIAKGEYIVFCDSDDWLSPNLIEDLEKKLECFSVDIMLYGMCVEYEDGRIIYADNKLQEGLFLKENIWEKVLPHFFSDGGMESGIMMGSRCTKLFRRQLLIKNLELLKDDISVGEDDLATFATVLSADALYCIRNFYPYHYMRNNVSMIGKYDELLFQKFVELKKQMEQIAKRYQYPYPEQIEAIFLSNVLLCMKKEICRNTKYKQIRMHLKDMRENNMFEKTINYCSIKKYDLKSKLFAYLVIKKQYFILYGLTKIADRLKIGHA